MLHFMSSSLRGLSLSRPRWSRAARVATAHEQKRSSGGARVRHVWAERPAAPAGKTEQCGMDQVPARPCGGRAARREFRRRAAATRANEDQQRGRAAAVAGWWRQRRPIGGAGRFFFMFSQNICRVFHTRQTLPSVRRKTLGKVLFAGYCLSCALCREPSRVQYKALSCS